MIKPPLPGELDAIDIAAPREMHAPLVRLAAEQPVRQRSALRTHRAPGAPASAPRAGTDPLGDLAAQRAAAAQKPASAPADPFIYFVQAGAFRTAEDAEAQRAKLSLMGLEARVSEREQSGRQVFRVRVGPFSTREEADKAAQKIKQLQFQPQIQSL